MKKIFTFFVFVFLFQSVSGQKSVNRFIDKMKEHKKAYALTLPGWLIRTGFNIADEDELRFENGFQELIDGIKRLRVLYIDENTGMTPAKMKSFVDQIKEKDGYVDYAIVREQDNNVHVIVKEKGTTIKSLVVIASSDDGFTVLNLRTDIDMQALKNADLSFNKSL